MNTSKLNYLILSLPALATVFPLAPAVAALRINNSSLMQSQSAAAASAARSTMQAYEPQPARVITNDNGDVQTISTADMDACSAIYPNGAFDWIKPTTGSKRGGPATCAALVELRSYKNTDYNVLATAYLAAGDSMKCNVDSFHEFTPAGREFTYPADTAPTVEDVEKVMAQEQKSNAGMKILAAAVVGGIGGNLVGKADKGADSPLGTNKEKLVSTAIGAAGGAALMTASTQSNNYKVGSTILSTGINATAGAVAGNLMASGDDILKIEKCTLKTSSKGDTTQSNADTDNKGTKTSNETSMETVCLYGAYDIGTDNNVVNTVKENLFYDYKKHESYYCKEHKENAWIVCTTISLTQITFADLPEGNKKTCEPKQNVSDDCEEVLDNNVSIKKYTMDENKQIKQGNGNLVKIASAQKVGRYVPAMIEFKDSQGMFGIKHSDWLAKFSSGYTNAHIYDTQGKPLTDKNGDEVKINIDNFYPSAQSAEDGDMVDFSNRARAKSTLIGAGGGAALGALSGVSGANAEIQNRWIAAAREYEDSLNNVVCATGQRFLSKYNDPIIIPNMSVTTENQ
ncbi:MAG: hypothetical protein IJS34_00015 [Alphaproteobacteria bacterium]|nr:hypothetical protein [Alphaproteobacteria bacterium]